eukprot:jgi/Tetstr1/439315/TSEL_027755.t2
MESDVPAAAAMHLAYAATFDLMCMYLVCGRCSASTRRLLPQPPMMPPSRPPLGDRTLAYADRFPPTDDMSYGAEGAICVFAGLLLRNNSPAVIVRKMAERRVRLREVGDAVRAGFSVCGMQQLWRESRDGSEVHNYHMEAGKLPAGTSRSARRRKRRRSARARAASAKAAEGGADAAADGVPPAVVDAHRRAAKLTAVQELRRARQALDTADLGMVSDAAAALPVPEGLHPPLANTGPEYSHPDREEPPDLRRAPPSVAMRMSGTVFALHKDDPAAREERAKTGEPLRVRPLGVGSVLVRLASAHAMMQVGADAREAMGPVQRSFQSGVGYETTHMSMREALQLFGGRGTGYGCHHGAMRLLVVCAVLQTGFLSRMMSPSKLDPFLATVDAAKVSAAFSLLGLDACDQSTPRMEDAIVQMSMPADCGGLNMALLQSEAPAAFYSAQSVVLPKLVREYGPALGPSYEAVRAEVSSVATSALPWARETRRVYDTRSDLTLVGWEGPACDYMIDFACVSSTTPTWGNERPPLVQPGGRGDRGGAQQAGGG